MLNLAIIGLGAWGKQLVASVQGTSQTVRFSRAVARTPAKVSDFAEEHGIGLGDDYGAALADPDVEGVVVSGPGDVHAEHAMAAIEAGKHVLVVKPLALRRADAEAMYEAAERRGLTLCMGYERCFLPAADELRRIAASGELGQILHAEGAYCVSRYLRMTRDDWKTDARIAPPGALADHMLYMMIELIGPVTELYARGLHLATDLDVADTSTVTLGFEGGASGLLTAIGATPNFARLHFFGTEGWAEMRGSSRLEITPLKGEPRVVDFPPFDALRGQLERFAAAVAGETPFPVPPANAIAGVAAVEAMARSVAAGEPVKV